MILKSKEEEEEEARCWICNILSAAECDLRPKRRRRRRRSRRRRRKYPASTPRWVPDGPNVVFHVGPI